MNNQIVIHIEFYFKGEKFSPSAVVDLDRHVENGGNFDALYPLLARNNDIDLYSYEYEMMLAEDIVFSDAGGITADFLKDSKFDFAGFEQALHDDSVAKAITEIANTHLSIDDLSTQPALKAALIAAYNLGRRS